MLVDLVKSSKHCYICIAIIFHMNTISGYTYSSFLGLSCCNLLCRIVAISVSTVLESDELNRQQQEEIRARLLLFNFNAILPFNSYIYLNNVHNIRIPDLCLPFLSTVSEHIVGKAATSTFKRTFTGEVNIESTCISI